MDFHAILGFIILIALAAIFGITTRLYQNIRGDAGYNVGKNHMKDLGFDDDDITQGKDDADADMYVFRKSNNHIKHGDK